MAQTSSPAPRTVEIVTGLHKHMQPLFGQSSDYDRLLKAMEPARFILLGEASHGTHEFYRERCEITKRLILEAGVRAVAVEADWPDAWRVNRYVQGGGDDASADAALIDAAVTSLPVAFRAA